MTVLILMGGMVLGYLLAAVGLDRFYRNQYEAKLKAIILELAAIGAAERISKGQRLN